MLKEAYGENIESYSKAFKQHRRFRDSKKKLEDGERGGLPVTFSSEQGEVPSNTHLTHMASQPATSKCFQSPRPSGSSVFEGRKRIGTSLVELKVIAKISFQKCFDEYFSVSRKGMF